MFVLLDIDGVLADFMTGACALHGKINPYDNPYNHGSYHINALLDIPSPAFYENMEEEFWATLPKMPDADEIIERIERRFGRENICLLSSPTLNKGCYAGKARWIREHVPQYNRSFLIGPRKEICAHTNTLLIDDYEGNITKFREHGGNAILVPRKWNRLHASNTLQCLDEGLKFFAKGDPRV